MNNLRTYITYFGVLKKKFFDRIMKTHVEFKHFFCRRLLRPAYVTFLKLVDATQILKPPEPTTHHSSIKLLILLPLRADLLCTLQYETPCKLSNSALRNSVAITALAQVLAILLSTLHTVSFH